jgi:hypothetical protein
VEDFLGVAWTFVALSRALVEFDSADEGMRSKSPRTWPSF